MNIEVIKPMVSVCVFAYNHEKYLVRALDSVFSQRVSFPFEVIIAEDYSTDSTLQIAQSYQARHPGIVRVEQSGQRVKLIINGHQTARHNFLNALRACRGKYIAFLDGDDYWLATDKLQRQVDYLEGHSDCSFVFHNVYLEQSENKTELKQTYLPDTFPDNQNLRNLLVSRNYVPTSSVVFRNNIPKLLPKIFYTCMFGDWPLHVFNLNFGNPKYMNEAMSVYKFGTGIWTSKKKLEQLKAILDYYAQVSEIMPKDVLYLVRFALANTHRVIASEYLKERALVRYCVHSLMGTWSWMFGILKSSRAQNFRRWLCTKIYH